MNTFGQRLKFTSFGESHGKAIGCVVDGIPAGIKFDFELLEKELEKRKGGKNKFATPRKEEDKAEILSGVFEGMTTGMPIAMIIYNNNSRSKDYENIKDLLRPAHADFTYFHKFGIRDYRGGGRASARESVARVAAGAVATMLLNEFQIKIQSGIFAIGSLKASKENFDFDFAQNSEIFCLDKDLEQAFKNEILKAKNAKDSIGGAVFTRVLNTPIGLGEVLYDKLDSKLAHALMGINAVKGFEVGAGMKASTMLGSQNNDPMKNAQFLSNNSGGILGGLSNGDIIELKTYFKPTPSIFLPQESMNTKGENVICELKGRHDPCVSVRGSVVVNAMVSLVLADCLLLNLGSKLEHLKKIYT